MANGLCVKSRCVQICAVRWIWLIRNELLETPSSTEWTSFSIYKAASQYFIITSSTRLQWNLKTYLDEFMVVMNILRDVVCTYMYHNAWSKFIINLKSFFYSNQKKSIFCSDGGPKCWLIHYLNLNKFISSDLILIVNNILINWSRFSPYRLCISVWISNLFFIILILRLRFIHRLYMDGEIFVNPKWFIMGHKSFRSVLF